MKNFQEVWETLPEGWLTEEEAILLWGVASKFKGPILEVGCYRGRSTCLLASLGRLVYCVDPFDNFDSDLTGDQIEKIFWDNLAERKITNVVHFRMKIENWKPTPVEFAYLDGDHTFDGTCDQIKVAINAGAKEICVHDYADSHGGLHIKNAIESFPDELRLATLAGTMAHCEVRSNNG